MADTRPSLYEVAMPGVAIVPDLAMPVEPPEPRLEGDTWVVEVPLREDAVWSDGHPITADDLVFMFDLAGDPWGDCHGAWLGVADVVAVDSQTVRIIFDQEPGIGIWPHEIGVAEVMAEHFWAPHIETAMRQGQAAAEAIGDPATAVWETLADPPPTPEDVTPDQIDAYVANVHDAAVGDYLNNVSGIGEPSGGPLVFAEWDPGVSVRYVANHNYYRTGDLVNSGDVSYEIGPFIDEQVHLVYGSEQEWAMALSRGAIDATGLPVAPVLRFLLTTDPDIEALQGTANGFWYLGFNLRNPPMSDPAFRRALAMMIDKDFLTAELFQSAVAPAWTLLPEANLQYFDVEAAAGIAAKYRNLDRFERLEKAVAILEEAGYTWDRKPAVGRNERGEPSIESGSGIVMPDGTPAPELEILSFAFGGWEYYWFIAYGRYVEHWLRELGFPARAQASTAGILVGEVWPGVGTEPTFDLYLLGWSLGNPAFPTFHESFFHSRNLAEVNDGNNAVGYANLEFDELADRVYEVKTVEEARHLIWQLETALDRDLPYIVMHAVPWSQTSNIRIEYPFTDSLGAPISFGGLVRIRE
jgi:ABC-type transport system substrate-binding protein